MPSPRFKISIYLKSRKWDFLNLFINFLRGLDRKMALEKLQRSHVVYLGIYVLRANLLRVPSTLRQRSSFISTVGLPSTLIRYENEAFQKRSSNRRNLKTLAFYISVERKHFENGASQSRLSRDFPDRVFLKHESTTTCDCGVFKHDSLA